MGKFPVSAQFSNEIFQPKKKSPKVLVHYGAQKSLNIVNLVHISLQYGSFLSFIQKLILFWNSYSHSYYDDTLFTYMKYSLITDCEATCKVPSIIHVSLNMLAAIVVAPCLSLSGPRACANIWISSWAAEG